MSILLPLAALLAGAIGLGVGRFAFLIARWFRAPYFSAFGAIYGIAVAVALFVPALMFLEKATTTTLIGMNPREGERRLEPWGLPANTTSDFCYRHSLVGSDVVADFQMAEADFLNWMKAQKWTAAPFQLESAYESIPVNGGAVGFASSEVWPVRQSGKRIELIVKRGYCYMWAEPDSPDTTVKIIYDLDSQRAYFKHSLY